MSLCYICRKQIKKSRGDSLFCSKKCEEGDKAALAKPNFFGVGNAGWFNYKKGG
jgi:hypothetical protein